jgi:hypothetical protein
MRPIQDLPNGEWLTINSLPRDIDEESLAEFLYNSGLDTTAECISIRKYDKGCSQAVISVSPDQMAAVINLLINSQQLGGHVPHCVSLRERRR